MRVAAQRNGGEKKKKKRTSKIDDGQAMFNILGQMSDKQRDGGALSRVAELPGRCQAENENVIGSKLGYCEKLPFEPQSTAQGTHLNHVWRFL